MISDHERRVLEELERCFEPAEPLAVAPPGIGAVAPAQRSPARLRPTLVTAASAGALCLVLVISGAALSGFALLLASAMVGGLWYCWPSLRDERAEFPRPSTRRGRVE